MWQFGNLDRHVYRNYCVQPDQLLFSETRQFNHDNLFITNRDIISLRLNTCKSESGSFAGTLLRILHSSLITSKRAGELLTLTLSTSFAKCSIDNPTRDDTGNSSNLSKHIARATSLRILKPRFSAISHISSILSGGSRMQIIISVIFSVNFSAIKTTLSSSNSRSSEWFPVKNFSSDALTKK